MVYSTVGDIFDAINETRDRTYRRVEGLSKEQAGFRTDPDRWSVGQLVEHIAMSEELLIKRLQKLLEEAEANAPSDARMAPFSLDELKARADGKKFSAPEILHPGGEQAIAESLARMRANRGALIALRTRFESVDGAAVTSPHPAFGALNLYQWIAFNGAHEARHLAQIEAIVASPLFPAA